MKSLGERFRAKISIDRKSGCWLWTGAKLRSGYGQIAISASRPMLAHRASLLLAGQELIEGLEVDHLCRTPACVNPAHLEQVTHKVNLRRSKKGQQTHCKRGHALVPENLSPNKQGRNCKQCDSLQHQERYRQNIERSRANDRKWHRIRKLKKETAVCQP